MKCFKFEIVRAVLTISLLLFFLSGIGQEYNLGDMRRKTIRYFDIEIPNVTEQSKYIVKVEHSPHLVYRVDKWQVGPDSVMTLRIQVNPDTLGRFEYKFRIQLSQEAEPREYKVIGNVLQMPDLKTSGDRCPPFPYDGKQRPASAEFHVTAMDPRSGMALPGATVSIISNGNLKETWQMDHHGQITRKYDEGFLYFVISYPGYETTEAGIFLDDDMYEILIPVSRSKDHSETLPADTVDLREQKLLSKAEGEKVLEAQLEKNTAPSVAGTFADTTLYKPANIVFVLDISESMRSREKLELMKFAMNQLIDELRDVDRVTVLTYGETAELYIPTISASEKEEIKSRISNLRATGKSSSGKGIQLAYKKFASKANNRYATMVVVVTDGAFNKDADKIAKTVKKYVPKGITFSVVGVQERNGDRERMKEAADAGNGQLVEIKKLSEAQHKLIRLVMDLTFRGR